MALAVMTTSFVPPPGPSYESVLRQISTWVLARDAVLSPLNRDALKEIIRRIQRLDTDLNRLLEINAEFCSTNLPEFKFDPANDTISVRVGDATSSIRLDRANRDVPIHIRESVAIGAYQAGT